MHALAPFAKAIAPLAAGIGYVLIDWVATGRINEDELRASIVLALSGGLVYWVPNARRPQAVTVTPDTTRVAGPLTVTLAGGATIQETESGENQPPGH